MKEHLVRCLDVRCAAPVIRFGQMCIFSKRGREQRTSGEKEGGREGRTEIVIFALPLPPSSIHPPLLQHSLLLPDRVWDVVSAESRDARISNEYENVHVGCCILAPNGLMRPPGTSGRESRTAMEGAQFKTSGQQMENKRRKRTNEQRRWS